MRSMMVLGAGVALMTAGAADAQRMVQRGPGASYPRPGHQMQVRPHVPVVHARPSRWGSKIGGRWWGGHNAPGGWAAYRQPFRGYRVPIYWVAPRFYVTNWSWYGLPAPVNGYSWARYYDDAVLIDGHGAVHDHRSGIDWDREDGHADGRSSGSTGAIAGAVVGGIAGNVIAGRGDKLAGTALGAGVGAATGYAIERAGDRQRERRDRERYDERHDAYEMDDDQPPVAPDRAPPPPGMGERRNIIIHRRGPDGAPPPPPPGGWRSADGRTTVITTTGGAQSYTAAPGAPVIVHAPYGGVTTVTVQSAPVVTTTTTTEIIEDSVTWTRPAVVKRKTYAKRVWRAPARTKVKARCVCK